MVYNALIHVCQWECHQASMSQQVMLPFFVTKIVRVNIALYYLINCTRQVHIATFISFCGTHRVAVKKTPRARAEEQIWAVEARGKEGNLKVQWW